MRYHRLGHVQDIFVNSGDTVRKGQKVATNGTGNGQWPAHCHYDVMTYKPDLFTEFVVGKTKQWVTEHYADPRVFEKIVMPSFDHYGYEWLQDAYYGGKHAFHPGIDLNGKGSGNSDIGDPLYSPCDGKVAYVHTGVRSNGGWGKIVVIKESAESSKPVEKPSVQVVNTPDVRIPVEKVETPAQTVSDGYITVTLKPSEPSEYPVYVNIGGTVKPITDKIEFPGNAGTRVGEKEIASETIGWYEKWRDEFKEIVSKKPLIRRMIDAIYKFFGK